MGKRDKKSVIGNGQSKVEKKQKLVFLKNGRSERQIKGAKSMEENKTSGVPERKEGEGWEMKGKRVSFRKKKKGVS